MLEKIPAAVGHALQGIRPGLDKILAAKAELSAPDQLTITSPDFTDGGALPVSATDDGAKTSPSLQFGGIPAGAQTLALVVEDVDSPTPAPLCHLLAWNIAPTSSGFPVGAFDKTEGSSAATLGKNSFLHSSWLPPDPPAGHGVHRYCFQLFALDRRLDLEEGAGRGALAEAMAGHVIARGMMIGTYERAG